MIEYICMGPFAHLGITAGVAIAANSIWNFRRPRQMPVQTSSYSIRRRQGFWQSLGIKPAIAVLLGAILSDLIDKPVGNFVFVDYFSNGRIFCHTLAFLSLITFVGLFVYAFDKKPYMLLIAFGVFMHLVLDQMWLEPRTFYWPLYGLKFPRYTHMEPVAWIMGILRAIASDPRVLLSELVGFGILAWLLIVSFGMGVKNRIFRSR